MNIKYLVLSALICLVLLSGCGGGGSDIPAGQSASIKLQVLINGVRSTEGIQLVIDYHKDGNQYFTIPLPADGNVVINDPAFCLSANRLTLSFTSSSDNVMDLTEIEYQLRPGENDLGEIDLGDGGLKQIAPEPEYNVTTDSFPVNFSWQPHQKAAEYANFNYKFELSGQFLMSDIESPWSPTSLSYQLKWNANTSWKYYYQWSIWVKYQHPNNYEIRQRTHARKVRFLSIPLPD